MLPSLGEVTEALERFRWKQSQGNKVAPEPDIPLRQHERKP